MTTVAAYRAVPRLVPDPLAGLEDIVRRAGPRVVRLDLGAFRPYLVTRPEHVQHVLGERTGTYRREGMLWRPLRPLIGAGLAGEGPEWARQRALMQPMFGARHLDSLAEPLADAVAEAVAALDGPARGGRWLDVEATMTRIAHRGLVRVFFGDRISCADGDALGRAVATAFGALRPRLLLPFVPASVPVPGDRAFRRAVRTVDGIVAPLVRAARDAPGEGTDLVSLLWRGGAETDREVRDDVVSILTAGIETTAMTLTWLLVALDAHPAVADRLRAEVAAVVGRAPPTARHLPDLRYTRMVVQEVLRLYPPAWFFPRRVAQPDVVDGVPVPAGATMLLSPYLTQRRPDVWEAPHRFDPERFAPGRARRRHRFAYFPFAGGRHRCLGRHFVLAQSVLVAAGLIGRFGVRLHPPPPVVPRAGVTLRPRQRPRMRLQPA